MVGRRRNAVEAALVLAVAFTLYAALRQGCFYKHDGWLFVEWAEGVAPPFHNHYLYVTACNLAGRLGLDAFVACGLLSAAGTAIGVACLHLGLRGAGYGLRDALFVVGLVALNPAVLFFATVVEAHGPFFGGAGLAALLTARLVTRPTVVAAALVGLAVGVARGLHGTGAMMPAVLAAFGWLLARSRGVSLTRRHVVAGIVAMVIALAVVLGLPWVCGALGWSRSGGNLLEVWSDHPGFDARLGPLLGSLWQEWLFAMAPLSFVALVALLVRRVRRDAVVTLLALVPYTVMELGIGSIDEWGAYHLPWVLAGGVLAVHWLGRKPAAILLILSLGIALHRVVDHEAERGVDPDLGRRAVATAAGKPSLFLIWEDGHVDSLMLHGDRQVTRPVFLKNLTIVPRGAFQDAIVTQLTLLGALPSYLAQDARAALEDASRSLSGPELLRAIEARFRLRELDDSGFRGFRLEKR